MNLHYVFVFATGFSFFNLLLFLCINSYSPVLLIFIGLKSAGSKYLSTRFLQFKILNHCNIVLFFIKLSK